MGRPLNKKYFGNRNIGTTGSSDDGIGGEGIASINWSTLGQFAGNSTVQVITVPGLPAPTIPGGVQATWTLLFEVLTVSTGSGKANLLVGDTFGVASIPGMIAKVTDISGTNAVFSVTASGASRGNALDQVDIPKDTQGITLTKIAGGGTAGTFFVDITFRVKESTVQILEKGSGYTGAETFTITTPGTTTGIVPAGTIVLTTDSGGIGSSTNQENAIIPTAYITGGSNKVADIISQKNARRFKVKTSDGTEVCSLVARTPSVGGEMAIVATDSAGGTYWVTKLSGRKATLVRNTGTQFDNNSIAQWGFSSPVANVSVSLRNA